MNAKQRTFRIAVPVLRLPHGTGLPLPARQTPGAAGFDLCAATGADTPLALAPGARLLVPTGFAFELPQGFEGQVRPRSGLALRHGITVLNSPGTIDSDYRGEVLVLLVNLGTDVFEIRRGDRIAQFVIQAVAFAGLVEACEITPSGRGAGGFGSTGAAQPPPQEPPQKKNRIAKKAMSVKRSPP